MKRIADSGNHLVEGFYSLFCHMGDETVKDDKSLLQQQSPSTPVDVIIGGSDVSGWKYL